MKTDLTTVPQLLTEQDLYLFNEGSNYRLYEKMGAHVVTHNGETGTVFSVWAPNARSVSVVGSFNSWNPITHRLSPRGSSGIWEGFIPGVGQGALYKFHIESNHQDYRIDKADPLGLLFEKPPRTASVVWDLEYQWSDQDWMANRAARNSLRAPQSIYEVHLGSWMRVPEDNNRPLTYRETAPRLAQYVKQLGFTHVEFLPVMEHPFFGSWGYQTTGYFAPTSRYGTPQEFMYLVDHLHQNGIAVILDWVPSHFPSDAHGLAYFDGTHLYEHADSRQGFHPDWKTHIFNFGRAEVRSFLMSSAMFWLDKYHIDGLRVDAVASMLYLDYARQPGEWIPNMYGGNENLEAIDFLRRFNELAHQVPGAVTIAEESTAFTGVSRPVYLNGLGFTMKWNMGWMHDMLDYFEKDPVHRKFHHHNITFSMLYAFTENFVLPISHDEVVHGKRSLLSKMPGDMWQKFANVRAFLSYMYGHPGKKLLFMGSEIGNWDEWDHERGLPWELLHFEFHRKLQVFARELNRLYKSHPAFYEVDYHWGGFEWVDFRDVDGSTISFIRRPQGARPFLLFVCNFTPVPRHNYRVGVPDPGYYREVFNSDAEMFGGGNVGNSGGVMSDPIGYNNHYHSLSITLPPLAVAIFESPGS